MNYVINFLSTVWILGIIGMIWSYVGYPEIFKDIKEVTLNNKIDKDILSDKIITEKEKKYHILFNDIYKQIGVESEILFYEGYTIHLAQSDFFKIKRVLKRQKIISGSYDVNEGKINTFVTLESLVTYCLIEKEGYIYKYRSFTGQELHYISRKKIKEEI